jgi:3-methyladenine DNA glycosylase/8-oxoguanine DNA glycosylase
MPELPELPRAPGAPETGEHARVREWQAPFRVDVRLALSVHGRGRSDPTFRIDEAGAVWRTSLTPDGPATIRVLPGTMRALPGEASSGEASPGTTPAGTRVVAHAWGTGAGWLLDALPAVLGIYDDISGFDPNAHPVLRDIARRHPGLRLGRTGRLMEALVPAIMEQKVATVEAHRAWRTLLGKFGTQPPGPAPRGMRVFPPPRVWLAIPTWEWHRAGVEAVRVRTIMAAASVAGSLERLLGDTHAEADRKLRTIPGIGVWTSAETRQRAAGDPDAVSVGDYNLPKAVGWALAGRPSTDDTVMLDLLAPYAGHRHRVTRLVKLSGLHPPRRGPRLPIRDYRSF